MRKESKNTEDSEKVHPKAMPVTRSRKEIRCYYCKKLGHIKRDCRALKQSQNSRSKESPVPGQTKPLPETRSRMRV